MSVSEESVLSEGEINISSPCSSDEIEEKSSVIISLRVPPVLIHYDEQSCLLGYDYFYEESHNSRYVVDKGVVIAKEEILSPNTSTFSNLSYEDKIRIISQYKLSILIDENQFQSIIFNLFSHIKTNIKYRIRGYNIEFKMLPQNMHGIKIKSINTIFYDATKDFKVTIIYRSLADNIKNNNEVSFDSVFSFDKNLHKCLLSSLEKINLLIFCTHCGTTDISDKFNFKDNKCFSCGIQDYLFESLEVDEYCTICVSTTKNFYTLNCGHKFHRACLSKLSDPKKCPNCRKLISGEN